MRTKTLAGLFRVQLHTIRSHLEGIDDEESLVPPEPGGSPLNWVVGHVAASRDGVLAALGAEPVLSDAERAVYARGSTLDPAQALPLDVLQRRLVAAQRGIERGLAEAGEEVLSRPLANPEAFPPGFETVYDEVAFLQFHEAYHCGQIGLLRRLLGREGVIR